MQHEQNQLNHDSPNPEIEYEHCPHCNRNFFKGKLQLHLKLCNSEHPMHLSPKRTAKRTHSKLQSQSKQTVFSSHEKKCPNCDTKLPSFLMQRHMKKCNEVIVQQQVKSYQRKNNSTEINFKQRQEVALPMIKKLAKQPILQIKRQVYTVKLRDELRCFRKAEQINEVQCISCGRYFSKAASLRHVPICEQLKLKQKYSTLLKRSKKAVKNSLVQQQAGKSCQKRRKNRSSLQGKQQSEYKLVQQ